MQQWLKIKGYENYQISNFGRVKSTLFSKEKILNGGRDSRGYRIVSLRKNKIPHALRVAHLVWDHFGKGQRNGRILQVDHIDNNPSNDCIKNLQLLTSRQNNTKNKINPLGFLGVFKCNDKVSKPYRASITINCKTKHLGYYATPEEASNAYNEARNSLEIKSQYVAA